MILGMILGGICVFIAFVIYGYTLLDEDKQAKGARKPRKKSDTDFRILDIKFDPPPGSTLKAHEQVRVTIKYAYSRPRGPLHFWARGEAPGKDGRYEPSSSELKSGHGTATRTFCLYEPGEVEGVRISVATLHGENLLNRTYPYKFTYVRNEEMEALADDGKNVRITDVRFKPPFPASLRSGTYIEVDIDYEVESEHGLDVWAIAVIDGDGSYASSDARVNGKGTVRRWVRVSEQYHLRRVCISMVNIAGRSVLEEIIDVDYDIT